MRKTIFALALFTVILSYSVSNSKLFLHDTELMEFEEQELATKKTKTTKSGSSKSGSGSKSGSDSSSSGSDSSSSGSGSSSSGSGSTKSDHKHCNSIWCRRSGVLGLTLA